MSYISNIIIFHFFAIDFLLLIFSTARPSGSHATKPIADFGPGESSATLLTRFCPPCYRNKSKSAGQERFLANPMGGGSDEITWALNPRSRVQLPDSPSPYDAMRKRCLRNQGCDRIDRRRYGFSTIQLGAQRGPCAIGDHLMHHQLTWSTTQLRRLKELQASAQQRKLTFETESSRNRSFRAIADALARKERDRLLILGDALIF
jgi:hypothetical protein